MDKPYQDLQEAYLKELRSARDEALAWWHRMESAVGSNDLTVIQGQLRPRWPAGPASFPRVVSVFRKHFIACERLNAQREAEAAAREPNAGWGEDDDEESLETVSPAGLLLDSLEAVDPELNEFMQAFVFTCIGTNPAGETA